MLNKLVNIIKSLEGKIVMFGIKDNLLFDEVDNNPLITYCDLLNCKLEGNGKGKNKYIKSIRKKYKKKGINYLIIDIDNSKDYINKIVRDSIYITNNKIYLYGGKENIKKVIKKYTRYTTSINREQFKDKFLAIIDVSKVETNTLKDYFYYFVEFLMTLVEFITELLG